MALSYRERSIKNPLWALNTLDTILSEQRWLKWGVWKQEVRTRQFLSHPKCYISRFWLKVDPFFLQKFTKQANKNKFKTYFFLTQLQGQALEICDMYSSTSWWYITGRPLIQPESLSIWKLNWELPEGRDCRFYFSPTSQSYHSTWNGLGVQSVDRMSKQMNRFQTE